MDLSQLPYLIALNSINGIGSVRLKLLIDHYHDPRLIWNAPQRELKQALGEKIGQSFVDQRGAVDPQQLYETIAKQNVGILTLWDTQYPELLKEIADPPAILFYKGDIRFANTKAIGVVGTRKMTAYGHDVTETLTKELVAHGFTIVSGLARGVDSLAHRATLAVHGTTIAVLGSGLNRIYPAENKPLADQIASCGLLLSELAPDTPATAGTFPARNRIISGLSCGVLVTEAASDSGSLITAQLALEQNREVFAVPGSIFSKQSQGVSMLIKEGGKLVTSVDDILEEFGDQKEGATLSEYEPKNDTEKKVLNILFDKEVVIDELVRETGLPSSSVGSTLSVLELQGVVKHLGMGLYRRLR